MRTAEAARCRRAGVALATRTSVGIGGEAGEFYAPRHVEELREVCLRLAEEKREPHVLGGGCNTLFPDGPFRRPVISTENLRGISIEGSRIAAGAGERLQVLIRTAIEAGLGGLEHFVGIPGTAGGAAVMNAGGSGRSFGDLVEKVEGLCRKTFEPVILDGRSIAWGYRTSGLGDLVVTSVDLLLQPTPTGVLRERARLLLRRKAERQPLSFPSAGCVFKNPPGASAGALIERAGLKGAREGGALVSPRHANFIVNETGQATARDVMTLLETVRESVHREFGVRLETEIVLPADEG